MTEDQIERWVERQFDRLDARLMSGDIDQETYNLAAFAIHEKANAEYERVR